MPVANIWSKVGVAVQTVLAATKTITGITKANPAVATSTAHGFTNGQEVVLKINGMTELNERVVRVANVAANTFELEGVDSTNFGTFVSGTAQLITFGASASTLTDVTASGGEAADIDATTIHDDTSKLLPGVKSAIQYAFTSLWDPTDPALIELKKADDVKGQRAVKITFASGAKLYFNGYPTAPLVPTGSTGETVKTPVNFKVSGAVQSYAT